jgi:hypothetical protein
VKQATVVNWIDRGRWSLALILALVFARPGVAQSSESPTKTLEVPGGTIDVTLPGETMKPSQQELMSWIQDAARAVSLYYGHFPVTHLTLIVRASNGSGVRHGVTYPKDGGMIRISVGRETSPQQLKDDWVLPHEMTHLAFPDMPEEQHWIEEGLATYIEPVARAQAGQLSVEEVWRSFIRDMPQGEPEAGDRGLDNTHTWGRTYWGGALFVLLADVRIRQRTHNRKGLQDALRAILDHGGNIAQDWSITQAFAIGDRATGTKVLEELYQQMSNSAVSVDLAELWNELGLSIGKDGALVVNSRAKGAAILAAITTPRPYAGR